MVKNYQRTINEANTGMQEPSLKEDGLFCTKTVSASKRIAERRKAFELIDKTADKTMQSQQESPLGQAKPIQRTMGQGPINTNRIK